MKLLVLGCNGMAGHLISLFFLEKGYHVEGFARNFSPFMHTYLGDVRDTRLLTKVIHEGAFDYIINGIGILNQYAEKNKSDAVFLNAYLPHFLADTVEDIPTRIIHMSTDCVFSGKSGPYRVNSLRDGETFYDRSKALGELEGNKNITLRNSIVGPDMNRRGIGLLNWFMQLTGEANGYSGSIWTGQTTLQLAKTMEICIKQGLNGLYNAVPDMTITKYELLSLFNHYMRKDSIIIRRIEGIVQNKALIPNNGRDVFQIPSYAAMVRELATWICSHRQLYPHYGIEC